jgi:hypothetical protein
MGAWGHLFDENDDAADWLADFEDSPDWATVDEAFAAARGDYIEAPDASNALAAAEVVAAGLGKASPRLEAAITKWASAHSSDAVSRLHQAIAALTIIRDNSELQELWQEAEEYADWQASVNETLSRL